MKKKSLEFLSYGVVWALIITWVSLGVRSCQSDPFPQSKVAAAICEVGGNAVNGLYYYGNPQAQTPPISGYVFQNGHVARKSLDPSTTHFWLELEVKIEGVPYRVWTQVPIELLSQVAQNDLLRWDAVANEWIKTRAIAETV